MADKTSIEWTDATWNPIRARNLETKGIGHFCVHASEGCRNCYSETFQPRFKNPIRFAPQDRDKVEIFLDDGSSCSEAVGQRQGSLTQPLRWKRPRKIFVCSMTDIGGDWVSDEMLDRMFAVMALCPQHTFQVLTKRPERARAYLSPARAHPVGLAAMEQTLISMGQNPRSQVGAGCILQGDIAHLKLWPLPNVWMGVSVEDQATADQRIPILLDTPAAKRFISAEPLLGPIDIGPWISTCYECGASCGLRLSSRPKSERCVACGDECGPETEPVFSEGCPKCGGELEPICPDCGHYMVYQHPDTPCLDWIIAGGESGRNARPAHPDWFRSLRDQCTAAGVAFLFKQWGRFKPYDTEDEFAPVVAEVQPDGKIACSDFGNPTGALMRACDNKKAGGRQLDGRTWDGYPA